MKRRIQWTAVLAFAGSATMAFAAPRFTAYSGACSAYDPTPVTYAAQRIQYVPATTFREVEAPGFSQTGTLARSDTWLEPVAERRPIETQIATVERDQPILSRNDCIGGVRFVRTTTRPRTVRFQRTLVRTSSGLEPVAERLEPVRERIAYRRLEPIRERIAYRHLEPVRERVACRTIEPVGERIAYRRLAPVGERVIYRRGMEPVAERVIARPAHRHGPQVIEEEIITTTRYHSAKKAKRSKRAKVHHTKARKLEPVAEKTGRCTYRKLEPVRERTFIRTDARPEYDRSLPDFSDGSMNFGNPYR